MGKKIGKVSGFLALLEEEDVAKKIDENDGEDDAVEKKDEAEGDDAADAGDGDAVERELENDDFEIPGVIKNAMKSFKNEVDAQTVDADAKFVGENDDDDEDDVVLLLDESDEDLDKKEESDDKDEDDMKSESDDKEDEDLEKKDEAEGDDAADAGDGDAVEKLLEAEDDLEEKLEEDEDEKLESFLKNFPLAASDFLEAKAILRSLVVERSKAINKRSEKRLVEHYKKTYARDMKKIKERVEKFAVRSAKRFAEKNKARLVETSKFNEQKKFIDSLSVVFAEYGISVSPTISKKFDSVKKRVIEGNKEIERLVSENEKLVRKVEALKIANSLKKLSEGMTVTDSSRLVSILEGLEVKNHEDFLKKATSVKKKVFSESSREYETFVEKFSPDTKSNLGIKNEASIKNDLVSAAASVLAG